MSFNQKFLEFTFDLGADSQPFSDGSRSQSIVQYRSSVDLNKAGGISMVECHARILGLDDDTMNSLTRLGAALLVDVNQTNTITITAGDADGNFATVFTGSIFQAWADIQAGPDVPFVIVAYSGLDDAQTAAPPTSIQGGADVATVMQGLAAQMGNGGLIFENGGISTQVSNPYLPGTLRQQAYALAQQANCNILIDDGTLAIWPLGSARPGDAVEIGPDTGMVGYPSFTTQGVVIRTILNPTIKYGAQINVTSELQPACGSWTIFRIAHHLESETVDGKWFSEFECSILGSAPQTNGG